MLGSVRGLTRGVLAGALALAILWPLQAAASPILLSEVSSDETPAQALFATLEFDVIGASVLVITVRNRTDESNAQFGTGEYKISGIYFNVTSNVTALSLTSPTSWSLKTDQRGGGEFGRFDYALIGNLGKPPHEALEAGASLTFQLSISGTGPFEMRHFTTEQSRIPPGSMPMIAQAKFVQGPLDDSAFGASVPEPGAALLLSAGLVAAALRRRPGRLAGALSLRRALRG